MLFRTALFLLLIGGITFGGMAQSTFYSTTQKNWLDTEGLYYLSAKQNNQDLWAFVITRHGETISPKENDPDAPTKPGFYIGAQHYRFIKYSVTRKLVSFETVKIAGRSFRFQGTVRHRTVCDIENIPELRGQLVEINGSTQKRNPVRFSHAVVC
jgi:hypothetical protein